VKQKPTAAQVVLAVRRAEWGDRAFFAALLCAAVLLVAGAVWIAEGAYDEIAAVTVGVPGTVAVQDCALSTATKDPQFWTSGWDCTGVFTATDGDLRLGHVKMFMHADDRPGPSVAARVSGPDAGWAVADGELEWVFAVPLVFLFAFFAAQALRGSIAVIEPIEGWPRPPKTRPAVPQMGNRARRRRRP
jgi:hypothetical protein